MVLMADKSVHISKYNFDDAKVGDVFDLHCIELFDWKLHIMHRIKELNAKGMKLRHVLKGKVRESNAIYYQVVAK
jgi:hypothetical protein